MGHGNTRRVLSTYAGDTSPNHIVVALTIETVLSTI